MSKILILGPDEGYFDSLTSQLIKHFEAPNVTHYSGKLVFGGYFRMVREINPQILILDYFSLKKNYFELIKILSYQPEKPQKILTLVPGELKKNIGSHSSNGFSTYFVKNQDLEDVIFYIRTVIDNNFELNNVAKAIYTETIKAEMLSVINYISRREVEIYTNTTLNYDQKVIIPSLVRFFGESGLKIKQISESPLGIPYKNRVTLETNLSVGDLDEADFIKKIKTLKVEISYESISVEGYKAFVELTSPKKISLINPGAATLPEEVVAELNPKTIKGEIELYLKTLFLNWLQIQAETSQESNSILFYVNDYSELNDPDLLLAEDDLRQIFFTKMDRVSEDIQKIIPTLIVVKIDEENTIEKVRELISSFSQVRDYFPYVLIFGYEGLEIEALRDDMQYHFIVASSANEVDFKMAFRMIKIFSKKKIEKSQVKTQKVINELIAKSKDFEKIKDKLILDHKITPIFGSVDSIIPFSLDLELVWISEFEVVFISTQELKLDDVIVITKPFRFQVIITPHIKESKESRLKNCYRGAIHWVEEVDRQALRRFVQQVSKLGAEGESSLTTDEILQIRRQYFVGFN